MREIGLYALSWIECRVLLAGVYCICRLVPIVGRERAGRAASRWLHGWERVFSARSVLHK